MCLFTSQLSLTISTLVALGLKELDPLHFLAGFCERRLNLSCLLAQVFECVLLVIRATFCVALVCVCMCFVFWFFWLSCQYLPSDWLERLLWGILIMAK